MQRVSEHQCGWGEEVTVEVEALQATYDDEVKLDSSTQQVSMLIMPLQASSPDVQQHFVECHVVLSLPPDYPSQPPEIQLTQVKGFSIRQHQLLRQLSAQAIEMQGELQLGLLFEAVRTWLTENNCPEGHCIFCLEELSAATATRQCSTALRGSEALDECNGKLLRLPCFHAYHRCCFADWWCWQQQAYQEQQEALERKTGATAAAALAQEALPPKDGATFQLSCPSCRVEFKMCHLPQPIQQQLQRQLAQLQQQSRDSARQTPAAAAKLTSAQLQPFLELQQRHASLFAQQQQRQGIIDTQVSYSITDWQATGSDTRTPDGCDSSAAGPPDSASVLTSNLSSSFNRCVRLPREAGQDRGIHGDVSKEQACKTRSRGRTRARGRSRGNSRTS